MDERIMRMAADRPWDSAGIQEFADLLTAGSSFLSKCPVRGDPLLTLANWVLECSGEGTNPAGVLAILRDLLIANGMPDSLGREIAKRVTPFAVRRGKRSMRRRWTAEEKRELLLRNKPGRCEICGLLFSGEKRRHFLGHDEKEAGLPLYVDMYQPRGLHHQDLRIEIDHKLPLTRGGSHALDNVSLLCGWCNRSKSDMISILDSGPRPIPVAIKSSAIREIPHPGWVVRLLAAVRKCQVEDCQQTPSDAQMLVSLHVNAGRPFPVNLRVSCQEHDRQRPQRLVSRELFWTHTRAKVAQGRT